MQVSESQHKAAGELVDLVTSRVGSGGAMHPETAVVSAARLAGSLLLRSFKLGIQALEPGTIVLSNEANEEGPQLIGIMAAMLEHLGISMEQERLGGGETRPGGEPEFSVEQSLSLLQEGAMGIARANGLDLKEAAQAAAMATALIVKESARDIGAETGFNVAAYGFIEGCKTVPPIVRPTTKSGAAQMECPSCGSDRVARLPPSQISPHPGYTCGACGIKMRAPGMIWLYLFVLAFGRALSGLFLFLILGGDGAGADEMPLKGFWLVGLGAVCVGYSVMQLLRPVPRRDRKPK